MTSESAVRAFAGVFILISLALALPQSPVFHSGNWLYFTAFVGFNLLQSAFTRFCPLEIILRKAGMKSIAD